MNGEASLYIHVPFCTKKCPYCHFFVQPYVVSAKNSFCKTLIQEWELRRSLLKDHTLVSIYFGGGTPSLLSPQEIHAILQAIASTITIATDCEITLEANPETTNAMHMQEYCNIGINRVSFGIQALHDDLLQTLGRTHTKQRAKEAVLEAHHAGIRNISIDLLYDLPHQELCMFQETLQEACTLPITHLSLYNLILEEGSFFYKQRQKVQPLMPSQELSLAMIEYATAYLSNCGFARYEISAFAKDNYQSRHNTGYWTARPFIGLGPSAFSYLKGKRFQSLPHMSSWKSSIEQGIMPDGFTETLPENAHKRELLTIELRLLNGVDLSCFQKRHGILTQDVHDSLEKLLKQGLIQQNHHHIALTERGMLFYDTVASELV